MLSYFPVEQLPKEGNMSSESTLQGLLKKMDEETRNMDLKDAIAIRNGKPLPPDSEWFELDPHIQQLRGIQREITRMKEEEKSEVTGHGKHTHHCAR